MEQPVHDLRGHISAERPDPARRTGILVGVGVLHIGRIWALVVGLASGLIQKLPEELKAEVVKPTEEKKPPPPPPPDLAHPPPPFVPAPEINIAPEAPAATAITAVQAKQPTVAPAITSPASIGTPHTCPKSKYYPDVSIRLSEQGSTTVSFFIEPDGSTSGFKVETSSGSQRLDDATISCVTTWRYKPALQNGQPIRVS
jgi:protein TonB